MKYTASFAVLSAAGLLLVPAYSRRPDFGTIYEGFPGEVDVDALVAKFDPGPDGNFLDGLDYVAPGPGTLGASRFFQTMLTSLFLLLTPPPISLA